MIERNHGSSIARKRRGLKHWDGRDPDRQQDLCMIFSRNRLLGPPEWRHNKPAKKESSGGSAFPVGAQLMAEIDSWNRRVREGEEIARKKAQAKEDARAAESAKTLNRTWGTRTWPEPFLPVAVVLEPPMHRPATIVQPVPPKRINGLSDLDAKVRKNIAPELIEAMRLDLTQPDAWHRDLGLMFRVNRFAGLIGRGFDDLAAFEEWLGR